MENATKALLIAAAILIAIVLISIGVFVVRQGSDAIKSVDMSDAEILAFNSKLETFEGLQRGSQVKQLLRTIKKLNNQEANTITFESGTNAVTTVDDVITTTAYYAVTFTTNADGLITQVKIIKQ